MCVSGESLCEVEEHEDRMAPFRVARTHPPDQAPCSWRLVARMPGQEASLAPIDRDPGAGTRESSSTEAGGEGPHPGYNRTHPPHQSP